MDKEIEKKIQNLEFAVANLIDAVNCLNNFPDDREQIREKTKLSQAALLEIKSGD